MKETVDWIGYGA